MSALKAARTCGNAENQCKNAHNSHFNCERKNCGYKFRIRKERNKNGQKRWDAVYGADDSEHHPADAKSSSGNFGPRVNNDLRLLRDMRQPDRKFGFHILDK